MNDTIHLKKRVFNLGICRVLGRKDPVETHKEISRWIKSLPAFDADGTFSQIQITGGWRYTYSLWNSYGLDCFEYAVFIELHCENEATLFRVAFEGDETFKP